MKARPATLFLSNLLPSPDLWTAEMPLIPSHAAWYLPLYSMTCALSRERLDLSVFNEYQNVKCLLSHLLLASFFLVSFLKEPIVSECSQHDILIELVKRQFFAVLQRKIVGCLYFLLKDEFKVKLPLKEV